LIYDIVGRLIHENPPFIIIRYTRVPRGRLYVSFTSRISTNEKADRDAVDLSLLASGLYKDMNFLNKNYFSYSLEKLALLKRTIGDIWEINDAQVDQVLHLMKVISAQERLSRDYEHYLREFPRANADDKQALINHYEPPTREEIQNLQNLKKQAEDPNHWSTITGAKSDLVQRLKRNWLLDDRQANEMIEKYWK
jgi:hypothetical protein